MSSGAIQDISPEELCRLLGEKDLGLDLLSSYCTGCLEGKCLCRSSLGSQEGQHRGGLTCSAHCPSWPCCRGSHPGWSPWSCCTLCCQTEGPRYWSVGSYHTFLLSFKCLTGISRPGMPLSAKWWEHVNRNYSVSFSFVWRSYQCFSPGKDFQACLLPCGFCCPSWTWAGMVLLGFWHGGSTGTWGELNPWLWTPQATTALGMCSSRWAQGVGCLHQWEFSLL